MNTSFRGIVLKSGPGLQNLNSRGKLVVDVVFSWGGEAGRNVRLDSSVFKTIPRPCHVIADRKSKSILVRELKSSEGQ